MGRGLSGAQSPFFISYAHTSPESDKMAERFYTELLGASGLWWLFLWVPV